MVSDYITQEATLFEYTSEGFIGSGWAERDTNAYFFQETVNLDFDIIDLTFVREDVFTVIPVAMSPIDIIHSGTPPVETNPDKKDKEWWKNILAVILLILLLVILAPILPVLMNVLVKILLLPFRLVGTLWNAIFGSIKKRGDKK